MTTTSPTPNNTYKPSTLHLGGLTVSSSYLEVWSRCNFEFFLTYLMPHPDYSESAGLQTLTKSEALVFGKLWHEAMYAYRLSGWKGTVDTGQYDVQATLDHLQDQAVQSASELESQPQTLEVAAAVSALFLKWVAEKDPITDYRIAPSPADPTVPMLEYDLSISIAGFNYVVKIDAGIITPEGYLQINEYKTSKAAWLSTAQREALMSIQGRGEALALQENFPTTLVDGVRFSYAVKDRGKKSELTAFPHIKLAYTQGQLWLFRDNVERWLHEIESKVASYERLSDSHDPLQAGHRVFPMNGMANKLCQRYGRSCEFWDYCSQAGAGPSLALNQFLPKSVNGQPFERPESGPAPFMDEEF